MLDNGDARKYKSMKRRRAILAERTIMYNTLFPMNLQLFAEGAEGTGATEAAAAPQTGENPAQGTEQTSAASAINEEQFNEYMKDKQFRGFVNKHTESIVKNRLKGAKETIARYEALDPILDMLSQRYQASRDDPNFAELLTKALEDDDALYAEEAEKRGVSVDTMRQISKTERELAAVRRKIDQDRRLKEADEWYDAKYKEAEALKQTYPSFDLTEELQNQEFVQLINLPTFDMRRAYEFIHKDEIDAAKAQAVAQQMEQKVANAVASGQRFPAENAVSSTNAAVAKRGVKDLSYQDRQDIARRVLSGEDNITFT